MLIKWRKYRGVKTETHTSYDNGTVFLKVSEKNKKIVTEKTEEQAASEASTGSSLMGPTNGETDTALTCHRGGLHEAELMTLSVTHLSSVRVLRLSLTLLL